MALKKLKWLKFLFVDRNEAETEQSYWNEKRKKHLAGEHTEGRVNELGVTETGPPSLSVAVAAGRALDTEGNDPEVESPQEVDCTALVPTTGEVTVFITLRYNTVESDPYFVDEIGDFQNKFVQDSFVLEATTDVPVAPVLELARFRLGAGATAIVDAADPDNPGLNEIDLRFVKISDKISLALGELSDVDPNEAAAFNGMNAPSVTNPIATVQDVTSATAALGPLDAEVAAARGTQGSLDARLDGALAEDGSLKPHAAAHQAAGSDQLSVTGLSGDLADPQDPKLHAAAHQAAGADQLNVTGLSGDLADPQDPKLHAADHQAAGADQLNVAGLPGVLAEPQNPVSHALDHQNGGVDEISVAGLSGALADPQDPASHAARHQMGGLDEINVGGLSGVLADPQNPQNHASRHQNGGVDEINVGGLSGVLADTQKITGLQDGLSVAVRPALNFRQAFAVADNAGQNRADVDLDVKPHYAAQLGGVFGGAVAVNVDVSSDGWIDLKGVRLPNAGSPIAKMELGTSGAMLPPFGQKFNTTKLRFAFYPETTPTGSEKVRFWVSAEVRGGVIISIFDPAWFRFNFYFDVNVGTSGTQFFLHVVDFALTNWPPGQPQIWTMGLGRNADHANDTFPGNVVVLRPMLFWWENSSEWL